MSARKSLAGRIWPNATAWCCSWCSRSPSTGCSTRRSSPNGDILSENPVWFPTSPTLDHFKTAVNADNFWTLVRNSVTVTVLAVGISLVLALFASFAIARMRFRGRKGIILTFMVAQMAPWEVMVIAIYMIVRDADMLNSLVPLTLFYTVMVLPLTVSPCAATSRPSPGNWRSPRWSTAAPVPRRSSRSSSRCWPPA